MLDGVPTIMTVEQVARCLRLHEMTIRQLARDGEIPAFKLGRQWRFKRELLERWIAEPAEMKAHAAPEPRE